MYCETECSSFCEFLLLLEYGDDTPCYCLKYHETLECAISGEKLLVVVCDQCIKGRYNDAVWETLE